MIFRLPRGIIGQGSSDFGCGDARLHLQYCNMPLTSSRSLGITKLHLYVEQTNRPCCYNLHCCGGAMIPRLGSSMCPQRVLVPH